MNVWLIIPAHGRERVSAVAFAGIAWTIQQLRSRGIQAHAVVAADDGNLDLAAAAGFETVTAPNRPLGRKWNDAYERACRSGATHVMPCGSDDWIHPDFIERALTMSEPGKVVACRLSSAVSTDGRELAEIRVPYEGGDGVRLFPVPLLETLRYRPANDSRDRAIDGSIQDRLRRVWFRGWIYTDLGAWQIVDFKTSHNLTSYERLRDAYADRVDADPWRLLERRYPAELVENAKNLYRSRP